MWTQGLIFWAHVDIHTQALALPNLVTLHRQLGHLLRLSTLEFSSPFILGLWKFPSFSYKPSYCF